MAWSGVEVEWIDVEWDGEEAKGVRVDCMGWAMGC